MTERLRITERPVSPLFILAMENGLTHGRQQGREGWDLGWSNHDDLVQLRDYLFERLDEEVLELDEDPSISEAADVANFAMMIADVTREIDIQDIE